MSRLTTMGALWGAALTGALLATPAAWADTGTVHVGVTLSMTGPAASLGIPERNSIALLPKEIGVAPPWCTTCWTTRPTPRGPSPTRAS